MCGIAGIIYRDPGRHRQLGSTLLTLIEPLEGRGPDSCGIGLYGLDSQPNQLKLMLQGAESWASVQQWLEQFGVVSEMQPIQNGARVLLTLDQRGFTLESFHMALRGRFPTLHLVGAGHKLEIYKALGQVDNLSRGYQLDTFAGTHGIAHTRMATESIVDVNHCHPFIAGLDLAIVHNGQISNYYKLRFQLEQAGMVFRTHNDSEAIAHYIQHQLQQGELLEAALKKLLRDVDGTYTFLVSTPNQVGLVRDKYAAKPAVIYETEGMVAIASEYQALLRLPEFDATATIREPDAGEINVWSVSVRDRQLELAAS